MKAIPPELSRKQSKAGRKGGMVTLVRYGREHLAAIGRLGGRPRNLTLAEAESQFNPRGDFSFKRRHGSPHGPGYKPLLGRELRGLKELVIKEEAGNAIERPGAPAGKGLG